MQRRSAFPLLVLPFLLMACATAASSPATYRHTGGGLTSIVMRDVISKLPPVTPPHDGVRDGSKLMRTVYLIGDYQVLPTVLSLPGVALCALSHTVLPLSHCALS